MKSESTWRDRFPPLLIITGLLFGIAGVGLFLAGNPGNMGVCGACFLRDISGALGLHQAALVQYLRPEILGIVLGAFIAARVSREVQPRTGASPLLRFVIAAFVMMGALVFLGCPLRLALRLGAGDANALLGLAGFVGGIFVGSLFLKSGTDLGRAHPESRPQAGWIVPLIVLGALAVFFAAPHLLKFSSTGPGSMHAPIWLSLAAGLGLGALAQRSRFCFAGGIRDLFLFRSPHLFTGFVGVVVATLVITLISGHFRFGFEGQPIAHSDHLWNALGMALVGLGSVLIGGCPLRQLVLAAQGNADSGVAVAGLIAGAAIAHNFGLAASPKGVPVAGMIAVGVGLAVCLVVASVFRERNSAA